MNLKEILAPFDVQTFLDCYWGRKGLYIPGDAAKFENIFGWREINEILDFGQFTAGQVRLIHNKKELPGTELGKLAHWLTEGATLAFNGVQYSQRPVADIASGLAADVNTVVNVNSYASYPSKQGFDIHFDGHDVFIVQTEGEKQWAVIEPTYRYPLEKHANNRPSPPEDPQPYIECVMSPGDVMYIPRGHWHYAIAETPSVHLTVGPQARTGIHFLRWLADRLEDDDEILRQDFPFADACQLGGQRPPAELEQHLQVFRDRINEVIGDPDLMQNLFWFCKQSGYRRRLYQLPHIGMIKEQITEDMRFVTATTESPLFRPDEDNNSTKVLLSGAIIDLPDAPLALVEAVFKSENKSFSGRDLIHVCPDIGWDKVKSFLLQLYRIGVILFERPEIEISPLLDLSGNRGNGNTTEKTNEEELLFDEDWQEWIRTNLERGCAIDGIFRILIDSGFGYEAVKAELNYVPGIPVGQIANPLGGQ